MKSNQKRRPPTPAPLHCALLAGLLILLSAGDAPRRASDGANADPAPVSAAGLTGFTAPLRFVTLAPLRTGRIATIHASEGDIVEADQVIVALDDEIQQQRARIAGALAESTLEIELARVRYQQAQDKLARLDKLAASHAVSEEELSDARAAVAAGRLTLAQAEFTHAQARREYELQQALVAETRIRAPFGGYVAARLKHAGDVVEEREGVLELVQLDPLVVAFDCPLELAKTLSPNQPVQVKPVDLSAEPRTARVAFVSRVADAASQTCRVKLHVANPDTQWVAGMHVAVELAPAQADRGRASDHQRPGDAHRLSPDTSPNAKRGS